MNTQTSTPPVALETPPETSFQVMPDPDSLALVSSRAEHSTELVEAQHVESQTLGPAQTRKFQRNGRIARLPRLQRDMVNRMLWNAVPYRNIVFALGEEGFTVTDRNVSAWATGGYLEWRLQQEAVVENTLNQDHLLDFLRREDAPELPEVGLQAAATRLSQVLLQKLARSEDPEKNFDGYSKMVDLLCRLNREISTIQKTRDDSRRTLGREYDPTRVKETDRIETLENERYCSNPPSDSNLGKPPEPPMVPPIPTSTLMARDAAEIRHAEEHARAKHTVAMMKALSNQYAQKENPAAPGSGPAAANSDPKPASVPASTVASR